MKRAFTLIEIIVTLLIMGILSAGILVSIKHLYIRAAKSDAISRLSMDSQVVLDSLSSLLYDRVPSTLIGYNPSTGKFQSIYQIDKTFRVLEWVGVAKESYNRRFYSGFTDLDKSDKDSNTLVSFDINSSGLNDTLVRKFGGGSISNSDIALIFAGSFDDGVLVASLDFNDSFGWHGNQSKLIYKISSINDNNITLNTKPQEVYEKYYLVDSAYAVARGEDVNISACSGIDKSLVDKDTLLLFYNFRPWKGETFCGDINGADKEGNVTILLKNATGFEAGIMNENIYFNLTLSKEIKGSQNSVTMSKQKVVF